MTAPLPDVLEPHRVTAGPEFPEVEWVVAPPTLDDAAAILASASAAGRRVLLWGSGSHQGFGHPVDADIVLTTRRLTRVVDWQVEDLTLVVEGGVGTAHVESLLAEQRQTAVLPERDATATVGGVIATGRSGRRRLRYGPTRDRILEAVLVTGDGRVVRAGGRVVKNVTGYDIPRLVSGSFGALGLIGRVCLKLWPLPAAEATIAAADPAAALAAAFRPLAVLETEEGTSVYLSGTGAEVEAQAAGLAGDVRPGLHWPEPLDSPWQLVGRVPPRHVAATVARVRRLGPERMVAAHGVGEVEVGLQDLDVGAADELRQWCESVGGALVVAAAPTEGAFFDPWGTAPPTVRLQRRVKAAFDPLGVVNPGRLPGRV